MRPLSLVVLLAALHVASSAHGQGAPPASASSPGQGYVGLPQVTRLDQGDANGDALDPTTALAIEPLRLDLFGRFLPTPLDATSGCLDQMSDVKTGGLAWPAMRAKAIPVFGASSWSAPKLTLFGFSRSGCTLDGALGGGVTLTLPIRRNVFFVGSGGAIFLPVTGPRGASASDQAVRGDLVIRGANGTSVNVGVGMTRGVPQVSIGSIF